MIPGERTPVGVDGCKRGWVAVLRHPDGVLATTIHTRMTSLVDALPGDAIIVVDMPIGLPERIDANGRGPERAVRPLLGHMKSSVFSIPSRAAVHAAPGPWVDQTARYADHRRTSDIARATSSPPRGVSIQAFGIFGKIREIDDLLTVRLDLRTRLVESHPEVAFCCLNDWRPLTHRKKLKGRVNAAGMDERKHLLAAAGLDRSFLEQVPPKGASLDDFLDACAMLTVAERHARSWTIPFPGSGLVDGRGIPIAIWA